MQKKLSMLATAAVLGVTVTACSGTGTGQRPSSFTQSAEQLAPRVELALSERKFSQALTAAEALVAAAPDDAGHRTLLGRAYLANGRYLSARTAFADAMTLGSRDSRTIVSLALCEIGLGNGEAARALLAAHIDHLPAGDYGLAMAMAGDAPEGVRALIEAARQPDATARTRQNLAYALALGGAWGQARLIAGQDLTAKEAERRVGQWSQPALRDDPRQRVATLTGVAPRGDDAGMPVHLALGAGEVTEMANAPDLSEAAVAGVQASDSAARLGPIETPAAPDPAPAEAVQLIDVAPAMIAPAKPTVAPAQPDLAQILATAPIIGLPFAAPPDNRLRDAMRISLQRTTGTDMHVARAGPELASSRVAARPVARSPGPVSDWVVQLGAFDSASVARDKWRTISRAQTVLVGFQEVHSQLSHNGRLFHRVAVRGFADRATANALCKRLTTGGQSCFVRLDDNGAARMARAGGQKMGAR